MISPDHLKSVLNYIKIGDKEGAKRLYVGTVSTEDNLSNGNYLIPAVYVNVKSGMRIMQEEISGPVVCIMPFINYNDAVKISND